jgi:hypothetical protein
VRNWYSSIAALPGGLPGTCRQALDHAGILVRFIIAGNGRHQKKRLAGRAD